MIAEYVFSGLIVADREDAIDWYSRFMGRPPDMLPNQREATWRLTPTSSLYIVVDPATAGRGVATIIVPDLNAQIDRLRKQGISEGELEEVQGAGRKWVDREPYGNSLSIVELVGGARERSP